MIGNFQDSSKNNDRKFSLKRHAVKRNAGTYKESSSFQIKYQESFQRTASKENYGSSHLSNKVINIIKKSPEESTFLSQSRPNTSSRYSLLLNKKKQLVSNWKTNNVPYKTNRNISLNANQTNETKVFRLPGSTRCNNVQRQLEKCGVLLCRRKKQTERKVQERQTTKSLQNFKVMEPQPNQLPLQTPQGKSYIEIIQPLATQNIEQIKTTNSSMIKANTIQTTKARKEECVQTQELNFLTVFFQQKKLNNITKTKSIRVESSKHRGRKKCVNPVHIIKVKNNWSRNFKDPETKAHRKMIEKQQLALNGIVCQPVKLIEKPQNKRSLNVMVFVPPRPVTASYEKKPKGLIVSGIRDKSTMVFCKDNNNEDQYIKKFKLYLEFLFKVNFSNQLYIPFNLSELSKDQKQPVKLKVYVQLGNNSNLIKKLIRKRYWFQLVSSQFTEGLSFCWTQIKSKNIHGKQTSKRKSNAVITSIQEETNKEAQNLRNYSKKHQLQKNQKGKLDKDLIYEQNRKILNNIDAVKVQKFITGKGFRIPDLDQYTPGVITNHLPKNNFIGSKKKLFSSMFAYYEHIGQNPFDYIPRTYHVQGPKDSQFERFKQENKNRPNKVWIIKPGQQSNRGRGIQLAEARHMVRMIPSYEAKHPNGKKVTYIIQEYIDEPFLYYNRKFDIRHYLLITSINGCLKAYWYKQGYIRTSSEIFTLQQLDNQFIHLTNDAIQCNSSNYEKYEPANKVSYPEFQRYLDHNFTPKGYNFELHTLKKMKQILTDVIKANFLALDCNRKESNFEIFGFDFMLDRQFKPWLIQINSNPCLKLGCPLLERLIPEMVEHSLRIGLDPLLSPKTHFPSGKRSYLSENYLKSLKYQLIFDQNSYKNVGKIHRIAKADEESSDQEQLYNDEEVQDSAEP